MIHFDSSELPDELVARAKADLRNWNSEGSARGDPTSRSTWARWAGDSLTAMMASRQTTIAHLEHPDASVRRAAACLVAHYWQSDLEPFAALCLRLAFEDPDSSVRGAALSALWALQPYIIDRTGWLGAQLGITPGQVGREDRVVLEQQIHALEARLKSLDSKIDQGVRRDWERLAGAHLAEMLADRSAAERYINHPEARLRRAALSVLFFYWKAIEVLRMACEQLVIQDPDLAVRLDAMTTLSACYANSDDRRMGRVLADVVHDDSAPMQLRRLAYEGLFILRGIPIQSWPRLHAPDFPNQVDWAFVDTFRPPGESSP